MYVRHGELVSGKLVERSEGASVAQLAGCGRERRRESEDHEVGACVGRGETGGRTDVEPKSLIEARIAENENCGPAFAASSGDTGGNQSGSDAAPLTGWNDGDRREGQCGKGSVHLREQDVADDQSLVLGHERNNSVTRYSQMVYELGLGRAAECGCDDAMNSRAVCRAFVTDGKHR